MSPQPLASLSLRVCRSEWGIGRLMLALATFVEVPAKDVEVQRAIAVPDAGAWPEPLVRIHCAESRPEDAFAAVSYRKHGFWVDDRDWRSKRTMSAILFLFTLSDSGVSERLPMLTVPAG